MAAENELIEALSQCREEEVRTLVRQRIDAGALLSEIVAECNRGMAELGERFARGECFIPELMFGGMIMKNVMEELARLVGKQQLPDAPKSTATVVIGTVQHDVHDIGKDIVVMLLRGVGFEVIDLGVDVPPQRFVEAAGEHQASVVGMSVLLTTCYGSVAATVRAVEEAGLRDKTAIMVGGAAASDLLCQSAGCDFYGKTAVDGVKFAGQFAAA